MWRKSCNRIKGFENGYYLEPTIIEVETDECRVNQEEIFGPVVTIMPFKLKLMFYKWQTRLNMVYQPHYGLITLNGLCD